MNILLCQALVLYIFAVYIVDVPSGTGDKDNGTKTYERERAFIKQSKQVYERGTPRNGNQYLYGNQNR